jgi:hypothetical protein
MDPPSVSVPFAGKLEDCMNVVTCFIILAPVMSRQTHLTPHLAGGSHLLHGRVLRHVRQHGEPARRPRGAVEVDARRAETVVGAHRELDVVVDAALLRAEAQQDLLPEDSGQLCGLDHGLIAPLDFRQHCSEPEAGPSAARERQDGQSIHHELPAIEA